VSIDIERKYRLLKVISYVPATSTTFLAFFAGSTNSSNPGFSEIWSTIFVSFVYNFVFICLFIINLKMILSPFERFGDYYCNIPHETTALQCLFCDSRAFICLPLAYPSAICF
jgi:hypothetical protein